jgi:hypothetical protein
VTYYIKRKLHRSITETETQQDFASLASLKSLVAEVDSMKKEMNSCFRRNESSFHDIQDAIASLTASVNKLGQQLRKSGCASPTAGVVSGGEETTETKSSSFSSDPRIGTCQIRQLPFMGEWAQRNCTSSQAADTIVSAASLRFV